MADRLQAAAMINRLLLLAAALVASASAQVHPPHSGSVTPFAGYQLNYTTDLTASTLTIAGTSTSLRSEAHFLYPAELKCTASAQYNSCLL